MNPIHDIADGRLRLLAYTVQFTGLAERDIISGCRKPLYVSVRRALDHALHKLGWGMGEIADGVYGLTTHSTVTYRLRKQLTEAERAFSDILLAFEYGRPTALPIPHPNEVRHEYATRAAAFMVSLEAESLFDEGYSPRILRGRAIATYAMCAMGISLQRIPRLTNTHQWSHNAEKAWYTMARKNIEIAQRGLEIAEAYTKMQRESA